MVTHGHWQPKQTDTSGKQGESHISFMRRISWSCRLWKCTSRDLSCATVFCVDEWTDQMWKCMQHTDLQCFLGIIGLLKLDMYLLEFLLERERERERWVGMCIGMETNLHAFVVVGKLHHFMVLLNCLCSLDIEYWIQSSDFSFALLMGFDINDFHLCRHI